jgi:hypothetical protein
MHKSNKSKIEVKGVSITIVDSSQGDYISVTDMCKGFGDDTLIYNWLRNKNTVEFLGLWEKLNNPNFKGLEFETFKNEAGTNRFSLTPRKWIDATNAIGLMSKSGKYGGGTFAHKDIAFEFGTWLSPEFKLLLIKEFQQLKDAEAKFSNIEWDFKRLLSKVNYRIHTDSIKENLIPSLQIEKSNERLVYASEADILNYAVFGLTAKQWSQKNPELVLMGGNIRDYADLHQLTVLANLESYNAILISQGVVKDDRIQQLRTAAVQQLVSLKSSNYLDNEIQSPNLPNSKKDNE